MKPKIKHIDKIISLLKKEIKNFENPIATEIGKRKDPFLVLISCIMSLRTKDTTTGPAAKRLFNLADNPKDMLKLSKKQIEKAIFPVGFYPTKAKYIIKTCKSLIKNYNGHVPNKEEELLKLPGIGRKCMGIVMCYGFNKNSHIPVDTHVHKLTNRLGWVRTKTPEKTEIALTKIIPRKYWHDLNNLLVAHGQNICVPVSPFCSKCYIRRYCPRIGVKKSR
ncbi:MAG: endonuclease III [Flavobacteriales bacterium]|jgi:endonuclease-3|nr:endonuclease III [Flavobacteriales bacterium]|tara:strand:- start:4489 stop:5151 length:663 start_codon:yes stop_codon:yes gene_type:complete